MPTMYGGRDGSLKWLTWRILSALSHGVVAITELELYDVADGGRYRVWYEGILGSADDDGNYSVCRVDCWRC